MLSALLRRLVGRQPPAPAAPAERQPPAVARPFAARLAETRKAAAQFTADPSGDLGTVATLMRSQQLLTQLAHVEAELGTPTGGIPSAQLEHPWVLGYVFGAADVARARAALPPDSPGGNEIVRRVFSCVFGDVSLTEVGRRCGAVARDARFRAGLAAAADDARRVAAGGAAAGSGQLADFLLGR